MGEPIQVDFERIKRLFFSKSKENQSEALSLLERHHNENQLVVYSGLYKYNSDYDKQPDFIASNIVSGFVNHFVLSPKHLLGMFKCYKVDGIVPEETNEPTETDEVENDSDEYVYKPTIAPDSSLNKFVYKCVLLCSDLSIHDDIVNALDSFDLEIVNVVDTKQVYDFLIETNDCLNWDYLH
jgi:hypothetical protein